MTPRQVTLTPTPAASYTPTTSPLFVLDSRTYAAAILAQDALTETLPLSGHWQMEFRTYGFVTLKRENKSVITSNFALAGDEMRWTDAYGSYACAITDAEGIYHAVLQADTLTLTLISDPCPRRAQLLGTQPWTQK